MSTSFIHLSSISPQHSPLSLESHVSSLSDSSVFSSLNFVNETEEIFENKKENKSKLATQIEKCLERNRKGNNKINDNLVQLEKNENNEKKESEESKEKEERREGQSTSSLNEDINNFIKIAKKRKNKEKDYIESKQKKEIRVVNNKVKEKVKKNNPNGINKNKKQKTNFLCNPENSAFFEVFRNLKKEAKMKAKYQLVSSYNKILNSICMYPLPIRCTQQALLLDGVGKYFSSIFDRIIKGRLGELESVCTEKKNAYKIFLLEKAENFAKSLIKTDKNFLSYFKENKKDVCLYIERESNKIKICSNKWRNNSYMNNNFSNHNSNYNSGTDCMHSNCITNVIENTIDEKYLDDHYNGKKLKHNYEQDERENFSLNNNHNTKTINDNCAYNCYDKSSNNIKDHNDVKSFSSSSSSSLISSSYKPKLGSSVWTVLVSLYLYAHHFEYLEMNEKQIKIAANKLAKMIECGISNWNCVNILKQKELIKISNSYSSVDDFILKENCENKKKKKEKERKKIKYSLTDKGIEVAEQCLRFVDAPLISSSLLCLDFDSSQSSSCASSSCASSSCASSSCAYSSCASSSCASSSCASSSCASSSCASSSCSSSLLCNVQKSTFDINEKENNGKTKYIIEEKSLYSPKKNFNVKEDEIICVFSNPPSPSAVSFSSFLSSDVSSFNSLNSFSNNFFISSSCSFITSPSLSAITSKFLLNDKILQSRKEGEAEKEISNSNFFSEEILVENDLIQFDEADYGNSGIFNFGREGIYVGGEDSLSVKEEQEKKKKKLKEEKEEQEYEIVMLLDTREIFGAKKTKIEIFNLLKKNNIYVEAKMLPIGDVLWIYRKKKKHIKINHVDKNNEESFTDCKNNRKNICANKTNNDRAENVFNNVKEDHLKKHKKKKRALIEEKENDEFVLEWIIERKTIFDLSASIIDGRYDEQRSRLLECVGMKQIIYLIEGKANDTYIYDCSNEYSNTFTRGHAINNMCNKLLLPFSSLLSAETHTQVLYGFHLIFSDSPAHTVSLLSRIHQKIENVMKKKESSEQSCEQKKYANFEDFLIKNYKTLKDFNFLSKKSANLSIKNLFGKQLRVIPQCGSDAVEALLCFWQTPNEILRGLTKIKNDNFLVQFIKQKFLQFKFGEHVFQCKGFNAPVNLKLLEICRELYAIPSFTE